MRDIFFRGKQLNGNEWFYGDLSHVVQGDGRYYVFPSDGYNSPDYYEVDPSTVGQYTGLTDKNGKKIFEGDIIAGCFRNNHSKQKFRVIFDDGMFLFDNTYVKVPKYEIYSMEVIGNFFDNPELLEGGDTSATEEERI